MVEENKPAPNSPIPQVQSPTTPTVSIQPQPANKSKWRFIVLGELTVVLLIGASVYFFLIKPSTTQELRSTNKNGGNQSQNETEINTSNVNNATSKTDTLSILREKMKGYQNYEVQITANTGLSPKFLRKGEKMAIIAIPSNGETIFWENGASTQFLYDKGKNSYIIQKSGMTDFGNGDPQSFLKEWKGAEFVDEEILDGIKVKVYKNTEGYESSIYINPETNLPVKFVLRSGPSVPQQVFSINFTRINQISDSDVNLPPGATNITPSNYPR